MKISLYLTSNVKKNQDGSLQNFTSTQQNATKAAVDIFMFYKQDGQSEKLKILEAPNFNLQYPLYIALCNNKFKIEEAKNEAKKEDKKLLDQYFQANCKLIEKSTIFYNPYQLSPVQHFKSAKGQRYFYGGARYFINLISQDILQQSSKTFAEKKGSNNPSKLLNQYTVGEGFFKDNLISNSLLNTIGNYKILKELINHQRDNVLCNFQLNELNDTEIESIQIEQFATKNILVIKKDDQTSLKDLQADIDTTNVENSPILIKFIQNLGFVGYKDLFDVTNEGSINLKLQFMFQKDNTFSAQIIEDTIENLDAPPYVKDAFLKINLVKNHFQIQVMACNGFVKLNSKLKFLDQLSIMGCEKIYEINDFFKDLDFTKFLKNQNFDQAIRQARLNMLKINSFKLQGLKLKNMKSNYLQQYEKDNKTTIPFREQNLKIIGFKQNCDLIIDNLVLGALLILCYLQYSYEGQIFQAVEQLNIEDNYNKSSSGNITSIHIDLPKFTQFKMEARNQQSQILSQQECCTCVTKYFQFQLWIIASLFVTVQQILCSIKAPICAIFQPDNSSIGNLIIEDIKNSVKGFDAIIKELKNGEAKTLNDVQNIVKSNQSLENMINQMQQQIYQQIESVPDNVLQITDDGTNLRISRLQNQNQIIFQQLEQLIQKEQPSNLILI